MEFRVINIDEIIDETTLIEAINDNIKTASFHREQIKRMKQATKPKKVIITPTLEQPKLKEEKEEEKEDFEDEVEFYLSQLKELNSDNLEEGLKEVLPTKKNQEYKKIVLRLILESLKVIKDIEEVIEECSRDEDKDEIEMFKEEISFEQRKISLLRKTLEIKQEEIIEEEQQENKLIFVPTSGGSIRVLDEIEKIPEEFYESFITLFNSIKDGTFKNVKRFTNNNALNGICEVKDLKVRIVFARLNKNSYAIITAFVKKTQNDKGYSEGLKSKVADYRMISDILKLNLENEEFIKLQQTYEQELYRKLGIQESSKTYVKGDK